MGQAARILVGITGGIAAYKVPQLIRFLRKQGAEIKAVCTPDALGFIGAETIRTVCGHPLYRDGISFYDIEHVRLAEWADVLLICPATANTIAKISHGIADNLLTTLALSFPPYRLLIAPAMNTVMWQNTVTQENIALLEKRGCVVLPVEEGELACTTDGPGRMLEIDQIADAALVHTASQGGLTGKRVLISSGPTEEPLDPVRVITNRSSGKMGAALARAALRQGAKVVVVSGPAKHAPPFGAHVIKVSTADEMWQAMEKEFKTADICIMVAAVSDFRPAHRKQHKLKPQDKGRITVELDPNPDILALLGKRKGRRCLVGFALETRDGEASARAKMKSKHCDMMVLNHAHEALGRDDTRITILTADGNAQKFPVMAKTDAAAIIVQRIAALQG
jgi:phosphopantothenoylcysteine decarboxylase/phosphopantothenate--cysteine ligase